MTEPLYGWVTSGMIASYGEPVPAGSLIHPRAEPEIGFLLGRDLSGPTTVTSVLAATEAVFVAVDILDSRYLDFRLTLADVIADNASAGRVVLGPQVRPPGELADLRLIGCVLRKGGEVVATAAGAAAAGHPAAAVAWLANCLAGQGKSLRAGQLVLSGGLTAPVLLDEGAAVTAEFDGLGSVEVDCR
ncbi:MAG: fumarylacetoacetate hydrolase family protein [Streptosporangiaceae bacterium]